MERNLQSEERLASSRLAAITETNLQSEERLASSRLAAITDKGGLSTQAGHSIATKAESRVSAGKAYARSS
jgi:hypothetical protein